MMHILESIFSNNGKWSSKRVFGGIGLIIVFGSYIYATVSQGKMPECTEFMTATCASLLGVDAVVSAINKNNNEQ